MRKALIAAAVATALFAVGAFAANLNVQSEDVASGSNGVAPCATNVDIDFSDPTLVAGVWSVAGATVRFVDSEGTLVDTCDDFDARLAVDSGSGYVAQGLEAPVNSGAASFTFTAIDVNPIVGASVVVDGATLTAQL